jgi:hypothetical protein
MPLVDFLPFTAFIGCVRTEQNFAENQHVIGGFQIFPGSQAVFSIFSMHNFAAQGSLNLSARNASNGKWTGGFRLYLADF